MMPSHQTEIHNQYTAIDLGDLIMGEVVLESAEDLMKILRSNPEGFSNPDDFSGASSLVGLYQDLFEDAQLDEIAAYCAKLIPNLILTKGSVVQIRALSGLAAEVVSIARQRQT